MSKKIKRKKKQNQVYEAKTFENLKYQSILRT